MDTKTNRSLRPKHAAGFLGIGLSTFWRYASEREDFPKLRRLSSRCTVVDEAALIAWRDAQGAHAGEAAPISDAPTALGVEKPSRAVKAKRATLHAVAATA
jgi:prophage regulatory protein